MKNEKSKTVLKGFIKMFDESNRTPNNLWVDQGKEFYNRLMQKWSDENNVLMYSNDNESRFLVADTFIKTLKAKIYKKEHQMIMTLILVVGIN